MTLKNSYIFLSNPYKKEKKKENRTPDGAIILEVGKNVYSYISASFPNLTKDKESSNLFRREYGCSVQVGTDCCEVKFIINEVVDITYVVYVDSLHKQWLFYPDYIVKKTNGEVWIIETKGGEIGGKSKNIDIQVGNKFAAFKAYAASKSLKWGFVRDKNDKLYINNTEYTDNMQTEHWKPLREVF